MSRMGDHYCRQTALTLTVIGHCAVYCTSKTCPPRFLVGFDESLDKQHCFCTAWRIGRSAALGGRRSSFLRRPTATLTYRGYSADNRHVQGVPRQGAETPPAGSRSKWARSGRGNPSNLIRVVPP